METSTSLTNRERFLDGEEFTLGTIIESTFKFVPANGIFGKNEIHRNLFPGLSDYSFHSWVTLIAKDQFHYQLEFNPGQMTSGQLPYDSLKFKTRNQA